MSAALTTAVEHANGSVTSLKKACKFQQWLKSSRCSHQYIVLVEWRELKPVVNLLKYVPTDKHPALVVAYVETQASASKCKSWVSAFKSRTFKIEFLDDISNPTDFV